MELVGKPDTTDDEQRTKKNADNGSTCRRLAIPDEQLRSFVDFLCAQSLSESARIERLYESWKELCPTVPQKRRKVCCSVGEGQRDPRGPVLRDPKAFVLRDPRGPVLRELLCSASKAQRNVTIRHHYSLPARISGTIYEKLTYAEHMAKHANNLVVANVPPPPETWFRSHGGSEDYNNGTLHFPMLMPSNVDFLRSYTIRRQKLGSANFLFLAAQLQHDRLKTGVLPSPLDSALAYMVDILSDARKLESRQYTPRKITVSQTKELLHAWCMVYVKQEAKYLPVLNYYLHAGYIVSITKKCGGTHEKIKFV